MSSEWRSSISKQLNEIIMEAGAKALALYSKGLHWDIKKDGSPVTNADQVCQEFLIQELTHLVPEASVCAEEASAQQELSGGLCWIIDPIDGTANFLRGIPFFSINVALCQDKQPIIAATYDPIHNELFHAVKGEGAYINSILVKSRSMPSKLFKPVIAINSQIKEKKGSPECIQNLINSGASIRRIGSAALALAYVAAGRFDAAMLFGLAPWDMLPGELLITEAGGTVVLKPAVETHAGEIYAQSRVDQ